MTGARLPRKDEAGWTLVELMIVLVFISIGILALTGIQTRSFTDIHSTGRHTRALDLAREQMEVARAEGFTVATSDSGTVSGFTWVCYVDSVNVGLKRVRTTVSWNVGTEQRSVQLNSLLSAR